MSLNIIVILNKSPIVFLVVYVIEKLSFRFGLMSLARVFNGCASAYKLPTFVYYTYLAVPYERRVGAILLKWCLYLESDSIMLSDQISADIV